MKEISQEVAGFWQEFCSANPGVDVNAAYQVWHFGDSPEMAEELCNLVLEGKKTAAGSPPLEFENDPESAPAVGVYSVITDYEGNPKCAVQTTEADIVPFNEVDGQFAFDEGEGDQSLDYWREVHWDYFSKVYLNAGQEPSLEMPVICERFRLLYPKVK